MSVSDTLAKARDLHGKLSKLNEKMKSDADAAKKTIESYSNFEKSAGDLLTYKDADDLFNTLGITDLVSYIERAEKIIAGASNQSKMVSDLFDSKMDGKDAAAAKPQDHKLNNRGEVVLKDPKDPDAELVIRGNQKLIFDMLKTGPKKLEEMGSIGSNTLIYNLISQMKKYDLIESEKIEGSKKRVYKLSDSLQIISDPSPAKAESPKPVESAPSNAGLQERAEKPDDTDTGLKRRALLKMSSMAINMLGYLEKNRDPRGFLTMVGKDGPDDKARLNSVIPRVVSDLQAHGVIDDGNILTEYGKDLLKIYKDMDVRDVVYLHTSGKGRHVSEIVKLATTIRNDIPDDMVENALKELLGDRLLYSGLDERFARTSRDFFFKKKYETLERVAEHPHFDNGSQMADAPKPSSVQNNIRMYEFNAALESKLPYAERTALYRVKTRAKEIWDLVDGRRGDLNLYLHEFEKKAEKGKAFDGEQEFYEKIRPLVPQRK